MKVEISKSAFKFLKNLNNEQQKKIRLKINQLIEYLEKDIVPVSELSIKKLKENQVRGEIIL